MRYFFISITLLIFFSLSVTQPTYAISDEDLNFKADQANSAELAKKAEAIRQAEAAHQERIDSCIRQLESSSPQCTPENLAGVDIEEGSPEEAELQLQRMQCNDAIAACVVVSTLEKLNSKTGPEAMCLKKLTTYDGGACTTMKDIESRHCQDFYNTCLKDAEWDKAAIAAALGGNAAQTGGGKYPVLITPEEYKKLNTPIPYCALTYEGCRDVNDVVTLLVNIGKMVLSIIGTLAFIMFIYGGFTMILAMGNPEKFKKGSQILVAAVVGIVISLSAYLLINFILDALGVGADFRAL